ncbi:MAG: cytochrome c biogenesis protein CcsA [Planctomycetaceae bacterium]|nr:cytochrome c biogenesis protein CcsA [Planctomycetaceae bacterium]
MSFLTHVNLFCFFASFAVAFGLEWTRLVKLNTLNRAIILVFGCAGFVAQTAYLLNRSGQTNLPPLLSSNHDWLLVLAWLCILIYLFVSCIDRNLPIGLFILPVVLVLIASAWFVSAAPNPRVAFDPSEVKNVVRNWAMLHATLLVFGNGGMLVAFVLSMMYLVQHRRLKHKQPGHEGLAFPNLERLARWNRWSVIISVPLLTLGMATGVGLALYTRDNGPTLNLSDPVILVDGVVWLLMVGLFAWLVKTERPPARQIAWLTLWSCAFVIVTMIGLQVLAGGVHPAFESWRS